MERTISKLGLLLSILALASTPIDAKALRPRCDSPKSIGGWIGNGDRVTNEIQHIYVLLDQRAGEPIGWFYRLENSTVWFQPNFIVSKSAGKYSVFVPVRSTQGSPSIRVNHLAAADAAAVTRTYLRQLPVNENTLPKPLAEFMDNRLPTSTTSCR